MIHTGLLWRIEYKSYMVLSCKKILFRSGREEY